MLNLLEGTYQAQILALRGGKARYLSQIPTWEGFCSSLPNFKLFSLEHRELLLFSFCAMKEEDVCIGQNQKLTLHAHTFQSSITISFFKLCFRRAKDSIFIFTYLLWKFKIIFPFLEFWDNSSWYFFFLEIHSDIYFFFRMFSAFHFQRQFKGSEGNKDQLPQ